MDTILQQIDINTVINLITVLVLLASLRWQLPSKADIQRLDGRIDNLEANMNERFLQQDAKMDALRLEMKADMQRLEDKLERANEYHARSVDLLDAIRRGIEGRREPL